MNQADSTTPHGKGPTDEEAWWCHFDPLAKRLVDLQRLASTGVITKRRDALEQRLLQDNEPRQYRNLLNLLDGCERQLVLAAKRDAIQKQRPEGCWCLGAGGARQYTVSTDPVLLVYMEACSCEDGEYEKARTDEILPEMAKQRREIERDSLWWRANIPYRFRECRLSTWPTAAPHILDLLTPEPRRSLFLSGPVGRGKTGLAVGYAWECLKVLDIHSLRFTTVPDMLAALRDTYNHPSHEDTPSEAQIIARYSTVDLLIMDDLGAEQIKNVEWVEDRLYQVIGHRHGQEKPTLFTSNRGLAELAGRIGDRVTERIAEMVGKDSVINLAGLPNLRD